jgi:hypothetical protein
VTVERAECGIKLTGNTLKVTYYPLDSLVIDLRDQYVTGALTLKIRKGFEMQT